MTAQEEYKKRSAGMNAMENAGAWGIAYWTAADVHSIKDKNKLTDEEAEEILSRVDNRIKEAMIERGWDVLHQELSEFIKEREA